MRTAERLTAEIREEFAARTRAGRGEDHTEESGARAKGASRRAERARPAGANWGRERCIGGGRPDPLPQFLLCSLAQRL